MRILLPPSMVSSARFSLSNQQILCKLLKAIGVELGSKKQDWPCTDQPDPGSQEAVGLARTCQCQCLWVKA